MKKNCVILKWNPAISSYQFIDFLAAIGNCENESDWSIYEHDKVKTGDQFFMLKVGVGTCGIVAAGEIISDPVSAADWSGRGRKVYYSDYRCEFMVNTETLPIIDSTFLDDNIPDFDWHGGHSGAVLNEQQAEVLNRLYNKYLRENAPLFSDRLKLIGKRDIFNDQIYIDKKLFQKIQGE